MIGIFFIAFVVYKKTMNFNGNKFTSALKVEDMLRLSQRKSLYIINVQGERFLIASDLESTTFLAKLDSDTKDNGGKNVSNAGANALKSKSNLIDALLKSGTSKEEEHPAHDEIKKYLKELETLDSVTSEIEKTEDDYSNAVDIENLRNSRNSKTVMKNILKELENNSKRTNI